MDLGDKDKFGLEKRDGDPPLNYHSPNMSSDWRFGSSNLTNPSMNLIPTDNSIAACRGDLMSSASAVSMVDSFCPTLWDHHNSQNLGFCDNNVQTSTSTANTIETSKGVLGSLRSSIDKVLDMGWNSTNSIPKGGAFLQSGVGILPQSLSQFPTDSAFIERAARFSCFNGGNYSGMVNPYNISESMSPYSNGGGTIHGTPELTSINGSNPVLGIQTQKSRPNMLEVGKDVSLCVEHGTTEGSPIKNERQIGSFIRHLDESKQGTCVSSNESDEAEYSGGGGQEEPSMLENISRELSSIKGLGGKKRKRIGQDTELDHAKGSLQLPGEAVKDNTETKQKGDQNPNSANTKPTGKHGKDSSQALDAAKEDYIHVRARRGQATNSHSLAERVRREKISERMKFLQDLVPGCSKVTGKAVMLDEIINYVQSLQRQVEFLSMKLATVNPRLDFNIEGLLAKDFLQSRGGGGPSSTMGFTPDMSMAQPQLHPSQHGLIQAGIPCMGNPSDVLRRTISSQLTAMSGGYKEPTPQLSNVWDDELHNVVQMSFGTGAPFNSQDSSGSLPPGHMKVEL